MWRRECYVKVQKWIPNIPLAWLGKGCYNPKRSANNGYCMSLVLVAYKYRGDSAICSWDGEQMTVITGSVLLSALQETMQPGDSWPWKASFNPWDRFPEVWTKWMVVKQWQTL